MRSQNSKPSRCVSREGSSPRDLLPATISTSGDLDITGWRGSVAMYVESDGFAEETSLEIGFLELFTLPLNASTAESLDGVSADTAAYLELLSHGDVSDAVDEQFDYPVVSGLLILDRAYVHPALRGHDIGAWAAVQAVHMRLARNWFA
ncbi:hypothetical protein [Mycobacterium kansasii]|uniref:hypothetical protein n=1 Tax=Mycobacterium kansasii TaxID=1768 RepID=UPI0012D3382A|nr:hypothetical protein [Mycobacterium kansasii]